ncbi:DNA uptake protein ComE [Lutibacter oricola]|uniref:DNA uptake protein ComE n=1 Tax=Lutibacter oricola TaxID=762486 RepID=A0A1H2ZIX8_9FLAO|nr:helix-hairpin-helix domain-containing protein [Lutibacter oricola]SDX17413.1 DNA uptake protein ComE [Lutibacter oricola]
MKNIKSYFSYNKRQRNGIFFLLFAIVVLQAFFFLFEFPQNDKSVISKNEFIAFEQEFDSLKAISLKNKAKLKIFPFNPNFITDYKGYQLGMNVSEIDKLLEYRKTGKYVNSAKEFKKITGVTDSLLQTISPFFKFPKWVTSKKDNNVKSKKKNVNTVISVEDINEATAEDFKRINGVGDKLATRIVSYRKKLQGFSFNNQLNEVWGLKTEVVIELLKNFQVQTKPEIIKLNVNTATFKEVLALNYLDYELTKKIFNYRDMVAEIQSIEELKKIDGFPLEKFDRIALYLAAE